MVARFGGSIFWAQFIGMRMLHFGVGFKGEKSRNHCVSGRASTRRCETKSMG